MATPSLTWAERAKLQSSAPPRSVSPPAARPTSSNSDNWRAGSSVVRTPASSIDPDPRGNDGKATEKREQDVSLVAPGEALTSPRGVTGRPLERGVLSSETRADASRSDAETSEGWTTVVPKDKTPAPAPAVNVWSVRKEQLAAAVPSPPNRASPAADSTPKPTPADSLQTPHARTLPSSSLVEPAPSPRPTPAPSDPGPTASSSSTAAPVARRVPDGWSGKREGVIASTVQDTESWPSPVEEVSKGKAAKREKVVVAAGADEEDIVPKKKADKTKWIPIKADITLTGAPSSSIRFATSSNPPSTEKRTKRVPASGTPSEPNRSRHNSASERPVGGAAKAGGTRVAKVTDGEKRTAANGEHKRIQVSREASGLPLKPVTTTMGSLAGGNPKKASKNGPASKAGEFALHSSAGARSVEATDAASAGDARSSAEATTATPSSSGSDAFPPTELSSSTGSSLAQLDPNAFGLLPGGYSNGMRGNASRGSMRGMFSRGPGARGGMRMNGYVEGGRSMTGEYGMEGLANGGQFGYADQMAQPFYPNGYPVAFGGAAPLVQQPAMDRFPAQQTQQPQQQLDPYSLDPTRYWLLGQIEYYFSLENLCRDMFLRSKMDDQGWIDISIISSFNRIKNLSTDINVVRDTMCLTPLLEMTGQHVRLRGIWSEWLLPGAARSVVRDDRESTAAEPEKLVAQVKDEAVAPEDKSKADLAVPSEEAASGV